MHRSTSPTDTFRGYAYVTAQAVILLAIVFWRTPADWDQPGWVTTVAYAGDGISAVWFLAALVSLGRSLSAVPLPLQGGRLVTTGLYRCCRHPIYTGVIGLAFSSAVVVRSSWTLALAVALLVVLSAKARFEEGQLLDAYPDYVTYMLATPRFLPTGCLARRWLR
ncbi:MAG TPA: isoprenylcysteine carboxylmethyltransferase family protein [Acidimicrobiales bacterium]